ncbi:MAG: zinc ABC transporter substrate-binding protein [Nostoc sp.]|uniref:metal ABC transporter solute-binding protein, Zn/Mn family n=1 Tax=Nostoc sp. TaxID=1180 RepID=UPI002FFCAF99
MPIVSYIFQLAARTPQVEGRLPQWQGMITTSLLSFSMLVPLLASCSSGTQTSSNPESSASTTPVSSSSPAQEANASSSSTSTAPVQVVAAENFWGSIASQVGGDRVKVTSIISNPDTDPHDYEAKPTDARTVANARYVIVNGAGYDPWVSKLLAANPVNGRKELNVGDLVGKKEGDNPHLWYNPSYVYRAIDQITSDLKSINPADASYFDQQRTQYLNVGLKSYKDIISTIKQKYGGTPIGATESIFAYQSPALGLNLTTPPEFMKAIAEGQQPTASDKVTFDKQVTHKQIKVFVYNKQNTTPDINALEKKAEAANIPVVPITETLSPATATFQDWQVGQLKDLLQALAKSTGK